MHTPRTETMLPLAETRATREAFAFLDGVDGLGGPEGAGGISLFLGPSGCGKSALLGAYAQQGCDGRPGAVLFYRTEVVNTPLSLVRSLLGSLGLTWHGSTRGGLDVLELLLAQAGVRMLVVDDAILLARPTLEMLRLLGERTGVQLVLAGGSHLLLHLRSRCAPLLKAVRHLHEVAPLTLADVLALLGPVPGRVWLLFFDAI